VLLDRRFDEKLGALLVVSDVLFGRQYDKSQRRLVGDLPAFLRERDLADSVAGGEDSFNFRAGTVVVGGVFDVRPVLGLALIEVLFETEVVPIPLNLEVVARVGQCFQHRLHVPNGPGPARRLRAESPVWTPRPGSFRRSIRRNCRFERSPAGVGY
jgi:hypothetical protein